MLACRYTNIGKKDFFACLLPINSILCVHVKIRIDLRQTDSKAFPYITDFVTLQLFKLPKNLQFNGTKLHIVYLCIRTSV